MRKVFVLSKIEEQLLDRFNIPSFSGMLAVASWVEYAIKEMEK